MRYIDYATASMPPANAFWPIVHKRLAYQFEREVRLVLWPQRLIRAAQAIRPDAFYEVVADLAPSGYDVGIDPGILVEAPMGSPDTPDLTNRIGVQELAAWARSTSDEDRIRRIAAVFETAGMRARVSGRDVFPGGNLQARRTGTTDGASNHPPTGHRKA